MKDPLRKRFGDAVKALRLESGASQEAFADKCGFARSYMSRIERGGANPSLDAIETLAEALGVEAKTFFETPAVVVRPKPPAPVMVPFAADGTCFNPSLKRKRTEKFTVGKKGKEVAFDAFDAAVEYLKSMDPAYWRRPNKVDNWGRVVAVRWGALPDEYSHPKTRQNDARAIQTART